MSQKHEGVRSNTTRCLCPLPHLASAVRLSSIVKESGHTVRVPLRARQV